MTAESPLVGRDIRTLITQAPGANYEQRLGGISIDGSSASESVPSAVKDDIKRAKAAAQSS